MSSTPLPPPILYDPSLHSSLLPQLIQLHRNCVLEDGMLATFLDVSSPSSNQKLTTYWSQKHSEVLSSQRVIVLQLAPTTTATHSATATSQQDELAGVVMLDLPFTETGSFRCYVEKLMVSPKYRKMGIAKRLMGKLEEAARGLKRELIMLDTTVGSGAEFVYPKLGYKQFGALEKYGIHPHTGGLVDEMFFYKDLRDE